MTSNRLVMISPEVTVGNVGILCPVPKVDKVRLLTTKIPLEISSTRVSARVAILLGGSQDPGFRKTGIPEDLVSPVSMDAMELILISPSAGQTDRGVQAYPHDLSCFKGNVQINA